MIGSQRVHLTRNLLQYNIYLPFRFLLGSNGEQIIILNTFSITNTIEYGRYL